MSKIYVVGTGRCGTGSIAKIYGGLHEPEPKINSEAIDYHVTGKCSEILMDKLKIRRDMDTPMISDNKQSLVIDLIDNIDPRARFIWLIRNPVDCVTSFMRRGNHLKSERISPPEGKYSAYDNIGMICWFWKEKNEVINKLLIGRKYEVVFTEDLNERENSGGDSTPLSEEERDFILKECWSLYRSYGKKYRGVRA